MTDQDRPNLVVVIADQWRADCLGSAGHPVVETPHFDTLALHGTSFRRTYAAVPSCIAARCSLMTGLEPRHHGRVGYQDRLPWNYSVTMAGTLAAAGYQTLAVGKQHTFPARRRLGFEECILHDGYLHNERRQGQDVWRCDDYLPWLQERHGPLADYTDTGMGCNGYVVAPWVYDTMSHPTAWVTTESIRTLRRRDPTRPFFLYVSYHRPHPPLDPPEEYLRMYDNRELPSPVVGDWAEPLAPRGQHDSPDPVLPAAVDRARRAYYAQITFIDHQFNRIVQELHNQGVGENTAILALSDHGEMLYDHNQWAKAVPYEAACRVPLLVRTPPSWHWPENRQIDSLVELRDIFPTLCELAGFAPPPTVDGRSLVPLLRPDPEMEWREYLHGEHSRGEHSAHWIIEQRWKYVWFSQSGREQLFDLATDPQELHDLIENAQEELTRLRKRLIRELSEREEGFVHEGRLVPGRPIRPVLQQIIDGWNSDGQK